MSSKNDSRYNNRKYKRPITSYGIILFCESSEEILYQLCQRRDSISYAEFLKDNLHHSDIRMYIRLMSDEERNRCFDFYTMNDPESLWDDLWINHKSRSYKNDKHRCCIAFKKNMEMYIDEFVSGGIKKDIDKPPSRRESNMWRNKNHDIGETENNANNTKKNPNNANNTKENPWGFSKGRKHSIELEIDCAMREFEEETTIPKSDIKILKINPYEELYIGMDKKLYRTIYYVASIKSIPEIKYIGSTNSVIRSYISEEVSDMKWVNYTKAMSNIDCHKQKILQNINKILLDF
jgi:8-oxo-dGTP pyrophosphatase MutT (NUDIX family)